MDDEVDSNLEMKCSVDEAWYDGTLSREKGQIIVHFKDFEEDEERLELSVLLDPAKLRSRVRVRSTQLQDSECTHVKKHQRICGCLDDGENRRYYDAEILSITPRDHVQEVDGEVCRCEFEVLWLAGPKKNEETKVGCADICFLSEAIPEDDPMVKNMIEAIVGSKPRRRKLVTKSTVSQPSTPLPSLEPISSNTLFNQSSPYQSESRTASTPGEEPKESMQREGEQTDPDLASGKDKLNDLTPDIRRAGSPKNRQNNELDEAIKLGNGGDVVEPRLPGRNEGKKRKLMRASRRVIVISPEDIHNDRDVIKSIKADTPQSSKGQVKSNSTKSATPKVASAGSRKKKLVKLGEKCIRQPELTCVEQPSCLNSKNDTSAEQSNVVPESIEQPKRKRGRPRKNPLPEDKSVDKSPAKTIENNFVKTVEEGALKPVENSSAKIVNDSPVPKKQLVGGLSNVETHSSPEVTVEENGDEGHFVPPFKKRLLTRMHIVDNTSSDVSKKTRAPAGDSHTATDVDAAMVKSSSIEKQTLANRFLSVQKKHATKRNNISKNAPTPTFHLAHSTKEAASQRQTQVEGFMASTSQMNSALVGGQDETTNDQGIGSSKKKRRRRSLITTDDENSENISEKPSRGQNAKDAKENPVVNSYCAGGNELALLPSQPLAESIMSDPKLVSSGFEANVALSKQDAIKVSRLLLIENMEEGVSAYDAMQVLQENTPGVCAVHIMPKFRFGVWTSGYILYQDYSSAQKALQWLTDYSVRFVISSNGRPWIVSPSEDVHEPRFYGFAAHTAFKAYNPGLCGIISDQPSAHGLSVVTKTSHSSAYSLALKKLEDYDKYIKWYMELRERIVEDGKKS